MNLSFKYWIEKNLAVSLFESLLYLDRRERSKHKDQMGNGSEFVQFI